MIPIQDHTELKRVDRVCTSDEGVDGYLLDGFRKREIIMEYSPRGSLDYNDPHSITLVANCDDVALHTALSYYARQVGEHFTWGGFIEYANDNPRGVRIYRAEEDQFITKTQGT